MSPRPGWNDVEVTPSRREPTADRPYMPSYGLAGPDEGRGLLPWSWAVERLEKSRDYWLATTRPDGRPHLMPVWGVWRDDALWFGSAIDARKTLNLFANPNCSVATDDAEEPVVIEGQVERVVDMDELRRALAAENAKYETEIGESMIDPEHHAWFRLAPALAFGLEEVNFLDSPTRWRFS
jgi:nitroimidazol reductase NimA-like FMN-containing flavoprotein (pyridoxamine 5'-phosphate oxidase superfamily)